MPNLPSLFFYKHFVNIIDEFDLALKTVLEEDVGCFEPIPDNQKRNGPLVLYDFRSWTEKDELLISSAEKLLFPE